MDIRCRHCGEPWDIDELHSLPRLANYKGPMATAGMYEDQFKQALAEFRQKGCAVFGSKCSTRKADPLIGELQDLLGDDIDGLASELDNAEFLGLLDDE